MSSAIRKPGSASITPRRGSRIPRRICCSAQAFLQTKNIRLGPGGFLLPYHHPGRTRATASRCSIISPAAG